MVKARYYFGAPVTGGRVSYKVFRTPFWPTYRFPRPFDWLYRYWSQGDYPPGPEGGDLVASGEGRTDANGELRVSWETRAEQPQWQGRDMRYTVQAEVTDASRRVINGSGEVNLTPNWPAYNASQMQWLRFREAGGTLYWEYAAGATAPGTWTTLASTPTPFSMSAVTLSIVAGSNVGSTDVARFDNISTT